MKHLYLLLFALLFMHRVQSQNVGIGTATPAKLLDVNGDVLLSGLTVGHGSGTVNNSNTAIGVHVLQINTTGFNNVAIGYQSLMNNSTGSNNVAAGTAALRNNSTGSFNAAFGDSALHLNTQGSANTAIGAYSQYFNTSGANNTAVGGNSLLANSNGVGNTAVGAYTLQNNTTNNNTAIGINSLYANTTGLANTACGGGSLRNNITGAFNTSTGFRSLFSNTSGNFNTASGDSALFRNTTGSFNTATGTYALISNLSGTNNSAFGFGADVSTDGLTNATAIGNGAIVNASNKIRLGNGSVSVIEGNVIFTTSDGRFKQNVNDNVPGLDFITALRPLTYQYKSFELEKFLNQNNPNRIANLKESDFSESASMVRMGFIAQDVDTLLKEKGYKLSLVHAPTNATDNYSLAYGELLVPLVKAVQEQQKMINELNRRNEMMEKEIQLLRDRK